VVSDIHVPFHSEAATDIAFNDAAKRGIKGIILNGDIMDFHAVSSFNRDPKHRDIHSEIERGRKFLKSVRDSFPRAEIAYNEGNHEARLVHYLMRVAPELFTLPELSLPHLLRFGETGILFADTLTSLTLGKLRIIHGHEYRIGAGVVNVARVLQQRAGINIVCGHFHRSNEYIKRLADGAVIGAWSTGCLSGLSPYWLPMNEWNHGYALVDVDSDGGFELRNHTIIRGKVR
jgi:predicted phosphodiesterase